LEIDAPVNPGGRGTCNKLSGVFVGITVAKVRDAEGVRFVSGSCGGRCWFSFTVWHKRGVDIGLQYEKIPTIAGKSDFLGIFFGYIID